jgi:hypothetical protein
LIEHKLAIPELAAARLVNKHLGLLLYRFVRADRMSEKSREMLLMRTEY